MNYVYPDVADRCDRHYYQRYGAAKWWLEERWVVDQTLRFLSRRFNDKPSLMLDVGCGQGRLIPVFAPFFERIIGIEPDASRLAASAESLSSVGTTDIVLLREQVPEIEMEPADFILCSHVLQHISTIALLPFLTWISAHLKSKGLALLLFEKSTSPHSAFVIESERGKKIVTEREFNQRLQETGILPAHKIPPAKLASLLDTVGMGGCREYTYHIRSPIPLSLVPFALTVLNYTGYLPRVIGVDHAILARKKLSEHRR